MVQNWMDPFHQDKETRAFAKANGIQYMAYSSFGTQWQGKFGGTNPVLSNDVLQRIASKHSLTVSQVVLAWVIAEGCIAIPRSSQPDHITENFGSSYHSHHFDAYEVSTRSASNGEELSMSSDPNLIRLDMDDLEAIRALDGALGTPWD